MTKKKKEDKEQEYKTCYNCREEIPIEYTYCPHCRAMLSPKMDEKKVWRRTWVVFWVAVIICEIISVNLLNLMADLGGDWLNLRLPILIGGIFGVPLVLGGWYYSRHYDKHDLVKKYGE